jgi:hypothetical protein
MGDDSGQGRLVGRWPTPIFLDASLQKRVRIALTMIRPRDMVLMHPDMDECRINVGDKDADWLPYVGRKDWATIMRDQHIDTRSGERKAFMENNVRAFVLTGSGEFYMWDMVKLLMHRWDRIIKQVSSGEPGPYLYSVTRTTFRRLI